MTTRVLVLGADGFIGRHLIASLAACDWATAVAASRRPSAAGAPTMRVQLDATNEPALSSAMQGVDAVVNCISGNAQTIISSARAMFAAAARQPTPPLVVHLSSMAVYGAASGLASESAALLAEDPYGLAKIATESLCQQYGKAVVLRPGIVYGPRGRQWTDRVARWLLAHRLGDLGPLGDGICNLVYVDDVVMAISQAIHLPELQGHAFNLAMSAPPTWNEYFIAFARALNAVPVRRIGARQLKLEAKLWAPPLKIAEIVLQKAKLSSVRLPEPIPPSLLRLFQQDLRLEASSAEQLLQLRWMALAEGLKLSAASFQAH